MPGQKHKRKEIVRGLPPALSAATPLGPLNVVQCPPSKPRRRKGPVPGTVDRYSESDRALYPELKRLIKKERLSATAAALQLANDNRVAGIGSVQSRARRLAGRYLEDNR
jgi:hypothetical protein